MIPSIRPMLVDESTLVCDSWTRSTVALRQSEDQRSGSRYIARVGLEGTNVKLVGWCWFEMHRAWVKRLLADPSTVVLVATLPGHDEALGWACITPPCEHPLVVHYVYTITPARKRGVATALLAAAFERRDSRAPRFTHQSIVGDHLVAKIRHREAAPMRSEAVMR